MGRASSQKRAWERGAKIKGWGGSPESKIESTAHTEPSPQASPLPLGMEPDTHHRPHLSPAGDLRPPQCGERPFGHRPLAPLPVMVCPC